ncbi:hypothetical protein EYF80_019811 [Liparis tanakae]|uniref:Uncharacterized protein n=1 Tax=Liparis tanakae TaxID=230148 RepID=A0A4Z2HW79_9TELE|nr:hypothetical protein EYF80_019811 [Liparis tanakae]
MSTRLLSAEEQGRAGGRCDTRPPAAAVCHVQATPERRSSADEDGANGDMCQWVRPAQRNRVQLNQALQKQT